MNQDETETGRPVPGPPANRPVPMPGPPVGSAGPTSSPAAPVPSPPQAAPARGDGTGDARVDQVIVDLRDLSELPPSEQVAGYEAVHRTLQDTLATVDDS